MRRYLFHATCLLAVLVGAVMFPTDSSGDQQAKQIVIESRFVEVTDAFLEDVGVDFRGLGSGDSSPSFLGNWQRRGTTRRSAPAYLEFDSSNGVSFKLGTKMVIDGEKVRGVRMKAKQDNAAGFMSLGRKFSATDPLTIDTTIQLPHTKGIRTGSTFGVELDSPFVPIGGQFDNFLFYGASSESGGLRAFASLNGTNVGTFPFFSGATSIHLQALLTSSGVTLLVRPRVTEAWTELVTDLDFPLDGSVGVGVGMFGVDKGAKANVGGIRIEGPSIWADPTLTNLLGHADSIRENLATAHEAMTREDGYGNLDPDIPTAEAYLENAETSRVVLIQELETAVIGGLLHEDTPVDDIRNRLDKAGDKLVPVLGNIPLLGNLFRRKDEGRVRKAEVLIFVTARLLSNGADE